VASLGSPRRSGASPYQIEYHDDAETRRSKTPILTRRSISEKNISIEKNISQAPLIRNDKHVNSSCQSFNWSV
jgi:hypothetical protein